MARSSSTLVDRSPCLAVHPRRDALDDVEALARADVAEAARLLDERLAGARLRQPVLELPLLGLQRLHVGCAAGELVLGVEVAPQRTRVEQPDEHDRGEADPAHDVARARRFA